MTAPLDTPEPLPPLSESGGLVALFPDDSIPLGSPEGCDDVDVDVVEREDSGVEDADGVDDDDDEDCTSSDDDDDDVVKASISST